MFNNSINLETPAEVKRKIKIEKKIESEVFDRDVLLTIGYLMNKKIISSIDFPISKGKEAYVFRATAGKKAQELGYNFLAVKIYMIETSPFKKMFEYIRGDPRFRGVKKKKKDLVYAWTKKEFRNLKICEECRVNAPTPIFFKNNLLVMEYLGDERSPAPLLKDVGPPRPKENFKQLIEFVKAMYKHNLVHADISEYNILVKDKKLYLIDIGQGVSLDHPNAEFFLKRDIENIIRYFSKFGIKKDVKELLDYVKSNQKEHTQ